MNADPLDKLLQQTDPRTILFAGVALLVIGGLGGGLYGIQPAFKEYAALKNKHERASALLSEGPDTASSSIEALQRDVDALRDRLYGGAGGIPRTQIESFVVDSLDRISSRHGVNLLGITPDSSTSIWMFDELPYSVKVEGSFFAIHRWLYDVEEELRPMVVKQFQLSPTRDNRAVLLDLRVVAYRASEGTGA